MALLPIRIYPDPVLRTKCAPVTEFDDRLRRLAEDMVQTMYDAPGVGLAAPQIGEAIRMAIVDVTVGEGEEDGSEGLKILVNPEIVGEEGREIDTEGCLSIPGLSEKVARPARVRVRAQDLEGETFEIETEGYEARAFCHEIDHLDGVLFVDRLRGLRRELARRSLRKLKKAAAG